jgi:hypothetical protein
MSDTEISQNKQRQRGRPFQKGQSGNPAGRPAGGRNKATLLAQQLLDGEAEALARKVIDQALAGDVMCLRVCLRRLVPPRKDVPVNVELPPVDSAADLPRATGALLEAVSAGVVTPSEAQALAGILEIHRKSLELADLEQRLAAIEEKMAHQKGGRE